MTTTLNDPRLRQWLAQNPTAVRALRHKIRAKIVESESLGYGRNELNRRVAARKSTIAFTEYTYPAYHTEPFHYYVGHVLDQVIAGEVRRLMIWAPPQHGKSELVSVRLPANWVAQRPDDPVMLTSYGSDLAEDKSRQARAIVESDVFSRVFPKIRTIYSKRSVKRWRLRGYRGGMQSAGVGGPITGNPAMLGIIDDPFSGWESAQRQWVRDRVWDWYRGTFRTRVWEDGVIVIIMTRWHEDDLCGRLLAEQGDKWTVLRFPAIAETQAERDENNHFLGLPLGQPDLLGRAPGEPLCPDRYSLEALLDIKADVGPMVWAAEYQGVPRPPEGAILKRAWLPIVDTEPALAQFEALARYWDRAATQGAGNYTVGLLMGKTKLGLYHILDVVRGQYSSRERDQVMLQTAYLDQEKYRGLVKTYFEQEGGSSGKDSAEATVQLLAGFSVEADRPSGSKEVRAEPFLSQAQAGNVRLLKADWNRSYIDEMTAFPTGANDDQWDATSGAFNKLHKKKKQTKAKSRSVKVKI